MVGRLLVLEGQLVSDCLPGLGWLPVLEWLPELERPPVMKSVWSFLKERQLAERPLRGLLWQ